MSDFVLAIDQGTTSSRAIVFNARGTIIGMGQEEFTQHFPQSGWVEHEPEDIWQSVLSACREAMEKAALPVGDIAAIGITNQRETVLVWDRATGEPIARAIVWQDRRTAEFCEKLKKKGHEKTFTKRSGLLLDPYFSGTKVRWLLDNIDGARARAQKGELAFGTVDTFLIWKLTGGKVHATDATNASRTLMYNIETGDWDDRLLDLLGVPRAMLPEIKDCADDFGETEPEFFGAPLPIRGRCRRPAGGNDRAGLLRTGHDEIDLWHRLFRADQHRPRHGALEEPAADDRRLSARWRDDLCA